MNKLSHSLNEYACTHNLFPLSPHRYDCFRFATPLKPPPSLCRALQCHTHFYVMWNDGMAYLFVSSFSFASAYKHPAQTHHLPPSHSQSHYFISITFFKSAVWAIQFLGSHVHMVGSKVPITKSNKTTIQIYLHHRIHIVCKISYENSNCHIEGNMRSEANEKEWEGKKLCMEGRRRMFSIIWQI